MNENKNGTIPDCSNIDRLLTEASLITSKSEATVDRLPTNPNGRYSKITADCGRDTILLILNVVVIGDRQLARPSIFGEQSKNRNQVVTLHNDISSNQQK